ncbi:MAG TPA: hypothetical protein VFE27_24320 [Acidobacteriaceae bacterium]|jgi:hypothetical protein|nr:hypothetical protein [Acidobacteriaceae bacterium]
MCGGPSSTQLSLQSEEAQFYQTQIQAYNTAYSNFSAIQNTLNKQFEPILAKGPNQMGFSDAELQNLNTTATQGTAQEYAKAKTALQENQATQGGGTSNVNLTGGPQNEENEELLATGAATESAEKLGIQQAGYQQGYNEWQGAVAGEEDLAAGWNPNSFSGSANNAAGTANSEANAITQEQESVWGNVLGALGGVAANAGGKGWSL